MPSLGVANVFAGHIFGSPLFKLSLLLTLGAILTGIGVWEGKCDDPESLHSYQLRADIIEEAIRKKNCPLMTKEEILCFAKKTASDNGWPQPSKDKVDEAFNMDYWSAFDGYGSESYVAVKTDNKGNIQNLKSLPEWQKHIARGQLEQWQQRDVLMFVFRDVRVKCPKCRQ